MRFAFYWLLSLSFCFANDKIFSSTEFSFSAKFPGEVHSKIERHKHGKSGRFQSIDSENEQIMMINAHLLPRLGIGVALKQITPKEIIDSNFEGQCKRYEVPESSIKKKWSKWREYDCLDFYYTTSRYPKDGTLSYHAGRLIFILDIIYSIRVVSFIENSDLMSHFDAFSHSFQEAEPLSKNPFQSTIEKNLQEAKDQIRSDENERIGQILKEALEEERGKSESDAHSSTETKSKDDVAIHTSITTIEISSIDKHSILIQRSSIQAVERKGENVIVHTNSLKIEILPEFSAPDLDSAAILLRTFDYMLDDTSRRGVDFRKSFVALQKIVSDQSQPKNLREAYAAILNAKMGALSGLLSCESFKVERHKREDG